MTKLSLLEEQDLRDTAHIVYRCLPGRGAFRSHYVLRGSCERLVSLPRLNSIAGERIRPDRRKPLRAGKLPLPGLKVGSLCLNAMMEALSP